MGAMLYNSFNLKKEGNIPNLQFQKHLDKFNYLNEFFSYLNNEEILQSAI